MTINIKKQNINMLRHYTAPPFPVPKDTGKAVRQMCKDTKKKRTKPLFPLPFFAQKQDLFRDFFHIGHLHIHHGTAQMLQADDQPVAVADADQFSFQSLHASLADFHPVAHGIMLGGDDDRPAAAVHHEHESLHLLVWNHHWQVRGSVGHEGVETIDVLE